MNTKHTPGPWKVCTCSTCGHINSTNFPIAITVGGNNAEDAPYVSQEERMANAKLIAATPELYDVCKELYDWSINNNVKGPIFPKLEAAIEKATA